VHRKALTSLLVNPRQLDLWLVEICRFKNLTIIEVDFTIAVSDEQHRVILIPHDGVDLFGKLNLLVDFPIASVVETNLLVVIACCEHITILVVELAEENLVLRSHYLHWLPMACVPDPQALVCTY